MDKKKLSFGQSGAESGIVDTTPPKQGVLSQVITAAKAAFTTTPVKAQIIDTLNVSNYGVVGFPHKSLQEIYANSGPLADTAEFQVDYWALNFRKVMEDKTILDFAVPLVFFNYPQEVSGARIDFEMKDIDDVSGKLLPIAQKRAAEVLETDFQKNLQTLFKCEFEVMLVPLNTIHKHPGSSHSQAFSGTDLTKTADPHGVVYPWEKPEEPNMPNFASIMALDGKVNNLAHSEYRVVNGELGKDIHYQQGRCLSFTIEELSLSTVERMMNPAIDKELTVRYKESKASVDTKIKETIVLIYNDLYATFKPSTDFVFAENLTRKTSYTTYSGGYDWPYSKKKDKKARKKNKKGNAILEELGYKYLTFENINSFHKSFLVDVLVKMGEKCGEAYTDTEIAVMTKEAIIKSMNDLITKLDASKKEEPETDGFEVMTRFELSELTRGELLEELTVVAVELGDRTIDNAPYAKSTPEIINIILEAYAQIKANEQSPIASSKPVTIDGLPIYTRKELAAFTRPVLYTTLEAATLKAGNTFYAAGQWGKTLDELVNAIIEQQDLVVKAKQPEPDVVIEHPASAPEIDPQALTSKGKPMYSAGLSRDDLEGLRRDELVKILKFWDSFSGISRTEYFYTNGFVDIIIDRILDSIATARGYDPNNCRSMAEYIHKNSPTETAAVTTLMSMANKHLLAWCQRIDALKDQTDD